MDDFDGVELGGRWEWFAPKEGPMFSLGERPGHLRLSVPAAEGGYNHWVGRGEQNAPMLRTAAPEGDFAIETHVLLHSYEPHCNFHIAAVVGFSDGYVVGWGPFFAPDLGNPTEAPEVWCEPTGQGGYLVSPGECEDIYLRIEKSGRKYTFSLRRPNDDEWTDAGEWTSGWPANYVGIMGKTFGDRSAVVADIDYFRLEGRPTEGRAQLRAEVSVNCSAAGWQLNRMRFGQFIENMHRCIYGGIWDEVLYNRKFTGAAGDDGAVDGWRALGARDGVILARDNRRYYCPCQSQRIEIGSAGEPAGIVQNVGLRADVRYEVRVVARQESLEKPLLVGFMRGDRVLCEAQLAEIGSDWTTAECELSGVSEAGEGSFFIATAGPGTVWLGAASVMPTDNIDGMRAEVIEAIREINPPVMRWPGGNFASGYDWRDGIGVRDRRSPRWDRAWNEWEWNDFGTDEFLRLCELVDCEPYICANCGEGTAREAAAWVEYCNGAAESEWGQLRAKNGHAEPYDVKIWGIGNEMYGGWQLGHLDATKYALKAVEFAEAMRAVDPSIQLVGVGVGGAGWGNWNREVCRVAGDYFDWLSVHHYVGIDPRADRLQNYGVVIGAPKGMEQMLEESYGIAVESAGRELPLAFDEWNVWIGENKPFALRDGLFACLVFNALNRLGEKCPMANLAQTVNVLGAIETDATTVVRTPVHQAFALYGNNSGEIGIPVDVAGPSINLPNCGGIGGIQAVASMSADRRRLYIAVVNIMPVDAVDWELTIEGFSPSGAVRVITLGGDSPETANTLEEPGKIRLHEKMVSVAEARGYTFPAHSATVFEFEGG